MTAKEVRERATRDLPTPPVYFADIIRRVIQRLSTAFVIAIVAVQTGAQQAPPKPDPFARLRFLAGTWRGDQDGRPGHGTVERTYQFILNDRFIQETNTSTYPPQEKNKAGEVHYHMSVISYDATRKRFVFRQFHTEGFVNTYVEEPTGDDKTLIFVSEAIENIPAGWRARETYTILNDNEFTERFDLAEPGREFELYSDAHLKRIH